MTRAVAADFTGRGRKDIHAVSLLAAEVFPQRKELQPDSIILLEQTGPGEYARHSLERGSCDYFTCAAGEVFGDGTTHLVTGSFSLSGWYEIDQGVALWENLGRRRP